MPGSITSAPGRRTGDRRIRHALTGPEPLGSFLPTCLAPRPRASPRHAARRLLLVGLAALLLKTLLALFTFGSTDVLIYEADLDKIGQDGGGALYRDSIRTPWCEEPLRPCPPFIHPPFMVHALQGWALLSRASGLPFRFWLRFTCALAGCGSLVLLARMLIRRQGDPRALPALVLFAASPIAILVSGFHGNTDPIMVFPCCYRST